MKSDWSNVGLGVMIHMLGGNEETVKAVQSSIGKKIKKVSLEDNTLSVQLEDDTTLALYDDGQSCCESRYMVTDDDLKSFEGDKLVSIEVREAPEIVDDYGTHEVQFLVLTTDRGALTVSNHNEHNGYYGGFWIVAKLVK